VMVPTSVPVSTWAIPGTAMQIIHSNITTNAVFLTAALLLGTGCIVQFKVTAAEACTSADRDVSAVAQPRATTIEL
jgi:hypothetical protein